MSNLPPISNKKKICIICEGYEEYEYFNKLKELCVWSDRYEILLENAESNGNLVPRYIEKYRSDSFDLVLIFCDTDDLPCQDYSTIKQKLINFHDNNDVPNLVIIFGNPCTMQIMLLHHEFILLKTHFKKDNAPFICKFAPLKGYTAKEAQRKKFFNTINKTNYYQMKDNVKKLPKDSDVKNSSNFDLFMDYFENDDDSWIININKQL